METYDDFDISVLEEEFARVADKKPGEKKFGNFLDKFVKMPKSNGYVLIRLLPPYPGSKLPWASCRIHNLASLEDRLKKPPKTKNCYCGRELKDGKWVGNCFYCEYYNYLYRLSDKHKNEGDEEMAKQIVMKAKAIKPQEKYYYNAIVIESSPDTGQSSDNGPLIASFGITLYKRILEAVLGNKAMKKKGKGNVFHPQIGRNLKVVREMKPGGEFPDYSGTEWDDVSILSEDEEQLQKWLTALNDVHGLRKVKTTDEMKTDIRIFEGLMADPNKSFDDSFLNENNTESHTTVSPSVSTTVTHSKPQPSFEVPSVEEDPLVDDEFANNLKNALAGTE